ncbi:carbohydrate ABC transporter permease [Actinokineospora sp. HUAS TT18]|uniref:carbohydrate ABC transporter permease n=1 Tax=Actinokineospora sp. HUAS TT18 TaxID=3447451 RepID=UPI003F525368
MTAPTRAGRGFTKGQILGTAFLFVLSVYFLLPLWWLLVSSTKNTGQLFSTNGFWFADFHLWENLSKLFAADDGAFLTWVGNTVLYAGVGAAVSTVISAAAGYVLAKYQFRGKETVFGVIIAAVLVPKVMLALPLYLMFAKLDITNTFWAVFLPSIVSPFGVYLCRVYAAASVPDELIEAGRIDGASDTRIFFTVSLRVMSPALVTVFLFQLVEIWNNLLLPMVMLQDDSLWPVTVGLTYWDSLRTTSNYGLTVTGAAVSVVPLIIAFIMLQRFWRSGLTAGAVK